MSQVRAQKFSVSKASRTMASAVVMAVVALLASVTAPVASPAWAATAGPESPAPPLSGPGLSLSGHSGWLWDGPPLALTTRHGAVMTLQGQWNGDGVEVLVQGPVVPGTRSPFNMSLEFGAPQGQRLMAASYFHATRAPYATVGPGIDISGMGSGCNEELGHFVVRSLKVVKGVVTEFDIKFYDMCDNSGPLQGEVWYVQDTSPVVAPALPGPGLSLSGHSGYLWNGPPVALTKKDGVVLTLLGAWGTGRTLQVQVQAPVAPGTEEPFGMDLEFSAPAGQHLVDRGYFNAIDVGGLGPGIDVSGMGFECSQELGHFFVRSLKVVNGVVREFDIKFYDMCNNSGPLQGEVRYVEDAAQVVAPALHGPGLSLSGHSGTLWEGPPVALTKKDGVVMTLQGSWGTGRTLDVEVQAPVAPGTEEPFEMGLEFSAPQGQHLVATRYVNATMAPFATVGPGIDISGMGTACEEELGHFVVRSLQVVHGVVREFDITFFDLCDDNGPLQGEVRYGTNEPA